MTVTFADSMAMPPTHPDGRRNTSKMKPQLNIYLKEEMLRFWGSECWLCGLPMERDEVSIDHIIPRSRGGRDVGSNLRLAHHDCNCRRGNGPIPTLLLTERFVASGIETREGEKPQALSAKHESPAREAGTPKERS